MGLLQAAAFILGSETFSFSGCPPAERISLLSPFRPHDSLQGGTDANEGSLMAFRDHPDCLLHSVWKSHYLMGSLQSKEKRKGWGIDRREGRAHWRDEASHHTWLVAFCSLPEWDSSLRSQTRGTLKTLRSSRRWERGYSGRWAQATYKYFTLRSQFWRLCSEQGNSPIAPQCIGKAVVVVGAD